VHHYFWLADKSPGTALADFLEARFWIITKCNGSVNTRAFLVTDFPDRAAKRYLRELFPNEQCLFSSTNTKSEAHLGANPAVEAVSVTGGTLGRRQGRSTPRPRVSCEP
jgi:hypothetical protein